MLDEDCNTQLLTTGCVVASVERANTVFRFASRQLLPGRAFGGSSKPVRPHSLGGTVSMSCKVWTALRHVLYNHEVNGTQQHTCT